MEDVLNQAASAHVVGGSIYDALVGMAAASNSRVLLTRDRRAIRIYDALSIPHQIVA
jgi:glucose dehydrogenase